MGNEIKNLIENQSDYLANWELRPSLLCSHHILLRFAVQQEPEQWELLRMMTGSDDGYAIHMQDGTRFSGPRFREGPWEKALKKAGIAYVRPYALRHTFAAWGMTLMMDINKLERLMGHGSKEMLFKTYGKYVNGLEEDEESILDYLGPDFLRQDKSRHRGESFGESRTESCFL